MKIAKKVCLIGRFAVGKTSLVRQYIENQFSEKYKTTVGVRISTKTVDIDDDSISMILWDIAGFEQEGHYKHYLRGTQGLYGFLTEQNLSLWYFWESKHPRFRFHTCNLFSQ